MVPSNLDPVTSAFAGFFDNIGVGSGLEAVSIFATTAAAGGKVEGEDSSTSIKSPALATSTSFLPRRGLSDGCEVGIRKGFIAFTSL